jgi:hypothetical protein
MCDQMAKGGPLPECLALKWDIALKDCLSLQWSDHTAMTDAFWSRYPLKDDHGYIQLFGESFVKAIAPLNDIMGIVLDYMDWLDEALSYFRERYQTAIMRAIAARSIQVREISVFYSLGWSTRGYELSFDMPAHVHINYQLWHRGLSPKIDGWHPFRSGLVPIRFGAAQRYLSHSPIAICRSKYMAPRPAGMPASYLQTAGQTISVYTDADGMLHNANGPAVSCISRSNDSSTTRWDIIMYLTHGILDGPADESQPTVTLNSNNEPVLRLYVNNGKLGRLLNKEEPSVITHTPHGVEYGWFAEGKLHRDALNGTQRPAYISRRVVLSYQNGVPILPYYDKYLPAGYQHTTMHLGVIVSVCKYIELTPDDRMKLSLKY